MKKKRTLMSALVTTALITAAVSFAAPANAAPQPSPIAKPGESCLIDMESNGKVCVPAGEDLQRAALDKLHIRVIVPEGAHGKTIPASEVPAGTKASNVLIELDRDTGWNGGSIEFTNSNFCSSGKTYSYNNFGSFNNQASSFKAFGYCKAKLWDTSSYSGSSYGYSTGASSLGAMNDATSSVQLTK